MRNRASDGIPPWVLWVIGPVIVLAAAIIVFALVLGIQAGQRQVEMQRRQQVAISLQRAADFRAEGRLQEAFDEYRQVLLLDPTNAAADEGMKGLLQLAAGQPLPAPAAPIQGVISATTPTAAPGAVAAVTATPAPAAASPAEQSWADAQAAFEEGEWQTAAERLVQLQQQWPDFKPAVVSDRLFNAYVSLAAEKDQAGNLEEALTYVDKALELRPDATELRTARMMADKYLDALAAAGTADWDRTLKLWQQLYVENPAYRDVRTQLQAALLAYGDQLAKDEEWCDAAEQYRAAVAMESAPETISRRDELEGRCDAVTTPSALAVAPTANPLDLLGTATPAAGLLDPEVGAGETGVGETGMGETAAGEVTPEPTATPEAVAAGPLSGRIVYSAVDDVSGVTRVWVQPVAGGSPSILVENAQQAALRPDGQRVVYRNVRNDSRGLTALDPASGLELRFTEFAEDVRPSWNGEGNRITFASNREGDRLWRVYTLWADVGSTAEVMAYGDSPAWSQAEDRVAYRGCDESGNRCGIWSMTGAGGDRRGLTTTSADDRPNWSPTGQFLVFQSDGRDGNLEIYRMNLSDGQVSRLTNSGGVDGLPVVSPDGQWVAFVSNRSGAWAVWAVPAAGGAAQQLFPVQGSLGNWLEQTLQWVN